MILVVDNGSIFTKKIIKFLEYTKTSFEIKSFDKIDPDNPGKFDSVILSGRRKNIQTMNAINSKIIHQCIHQNKSLLGICYGAEILALTVGGTIRKMTSAQKGSQIVNVLEKNPLCKGVLEVYQSHNYEISSLDKSLINLASSNSCKHEIIQYKNMKIFGTQFHPEMSKDGLEMIEKFIKL